jgi:hypothetical protein
VILTPVLATLALVVLWFVVFVGVHVLGLRSGRDNAQWLVRSYAACSAAMLASVVALSMWGGTGQVLLLPVIIAALTSACLFVLYVPAVYTILTSLSVATLVLLRRSGGRIPEASLYGQFASRQLMQQRLGVLLGAGHLVRDGCGYSLTLRGRAVASAFAFVKRLWRLGSGG